MALIDAQPADMQPLVITKEVAVDPSPVRGAQRTDPSTDQIVPVYSGLTECADALPPRMFGRSVGPARPPKTGPRDADRPRGRLRWRMGLEASRGGRGGVRAGRVLDTLRIKFRRIGRLSGDNDAS
jgi:hypothetical protein